MKQTIYVLVTLAALTACTKNPLPPAPSESTLVVQFSGASIPINTVDSAIVELNNKVSGAKLFLKMSLSGSQFTTPLQRVPTGEWEGTITVYTQKGGYDYPRRYVLTQAVKLPSSTNITHNAPNGSINDTWKPRVVLKDADNKFYAILAVNPEDPYFEINMTESKWKYLYVDRYVYQQANGTWQPVASQEYEKVFAGGITSYSNYVAFRTLSNAVAGKNWSRFETYINLLDNDRYDRSLTYVYTR
jgi:hypothetical protein